MWSTIFEKILGHYPIMGGVIFLLIIIIILTWKACRFYIETKETNSKLPNIEKLLNKIDGALQILNNVLMEKDIISNSIYSKENSPRVISDVGKELYTESGAVNILENGNIDHFIKKLQESKYDSFLELERECLKLMLGKMENSHFKPIQNFAYEHPSFKGKPLRYVDILFVMSLKLKEKFLEMHPEVGKELKE